MRFSTILCTLPLTLAASIAPRAATTVNNDITGINNAVLKLTAAINAYQGGVAQAQPVFTAGAAVHAINRQGYADTQASAPFSSAGSKEIVDNTNASVGKSIPISVTALESKKPLFDQAGLTSKAESMIQLLKSDHETFSLAVGAKLSVNEAPAGLAAAAKIDAVLQQAAAYYAA